MNTNENILKPVWPELRSSRWASRLVQCPSGLASLDGSADRVFSAGNHRFSGLGLLGLADDEGVRLNGGRLGARSGPDAFRQALAVYAASEAVALAGFDLPVFDVGNIRPGDSLTETHERVCAVVTEMLQLGLMPVGIGGGHDLTFPLVRAVIDTLIKPQQETLDGVYFDAHLDVREEEGSGMPFRRLIEYGGVGTLNLFGMDPLSNTAEHLRWFEAHGGRLADWAPGEWPDSQAQFVSICLDVVDMAQAPGVSAPAPVGWPAARLAEYAEAAGRNPSVCCFDIMELCPANDGQGRTARLAAHLFLRFLAGLNQRILNQQSTAA